MNEKVMAKRFSLNGTGRHLEVVDTETGRTVVSMLGVRPLVQKLVVDTLNELPRITDLYDVVEALTEALHKLAAPEEE